jgi:alanyl aminopeptidase
MTSNPWLDRFRSAAVLLTLFVAAMPSLARASLDRLPTDVVPSFEAIHLNLDAAKLDYTGTVEVTLETKVPRKDIVFHAQDMTLTSVRLVPAKGAAWVLKTEAGKDGMMTATATKTIPPGRYHLLIDFSNDFDKRATSLYRLETGGNAYTFTQFEATDARYAFPCWDEPAFKFPYQITLTVPAAHQAVTNTPIEKETVKDGQKTVVFQKTKPLPSYLLCIATGPLEFVPIPGLSIPGRVVVPKGETALAATAVSLTPPVLAALEKWFGRPYPYEKLDLIAVPEFSPGAMENPGAITYGDQYLLFDSKTLSTAQKRRFAYFTAHELAHMWFGDLVTMKWWDDLWLNESFADWMGYKITDEVLPELNVKSDALSQVETAMGLDGQLSTHAIRQPIETMANLFQSADELAYKKGEATIGMFEQWMGPDTFRKGVLQYLKAHEYGNATAKDLWDALSAASGRDVTTPMSTFLDQAGIPLVRAEILPDGKVRLTQKRYLYYGATEPKPTFWQIPVILKYSDGAATKTYSVLLKDPSMDVTIPDLGGKRPAWVYPNGGASGYYRWSLDSAGLQTVAQAASTSLEPLERLSFIQNTGALLGAGEIHGDQYMALVASFSNDPRPDVIGALAPAVGRVKNIFVKPGMEPQFAAYVRRVFGPCAKRITYDRAPGEAEAISLLRPTILGWMAEEGQDPDALARAESMAKSFLDGSGTVDPSLVMGAVRLSALRGDQALYDRYRKRFEDAKVPTERTMFLQALGSFRDPKIRAEALDYAVTGPLRPQELFTIPQSMLGNPAYQEDVFTWLTKNYDVIVKRIPPVYSVYLPYLGMSCEEDRLTRLQAFFSAPEHSPEGTDKEVARVMEMGKDCSDLRGREGVAVSQYLTTLAMSKDSGGGGSTLGSAKSGATK